MNEKLKQLAMNAHIQLHEMNEMVINGECDALETFVYLKRVNDLLEIIMKGVKEDAINEAQKYGEKTFERFGAKISVKNGAGRWDYKTCGSWLNAKETLTKVEKDLQQVYHAHASGKQLLTNDGELIEEIPQYINGATTIAITNVG